MMNTSSFGSENNEDILSQRTEQQIFQSIVESSIRCLSIMVSIHNHFVDTLGAAIPVINLNHDPPARRRTRNPDPVHAPDPSPGIFI